MCPSFANACKILFGSMPNLSNYANNFLKFYVCCAQEGTPKMHPGP